MAQQVDAKVYGYDELARGSRELAEDIEAAAGEAFEGTADKVAASARVRVPRRSGALAASVMAGGTVGVATVGYDGSVPYAGWVEFGGTRGRPYVSSGRYLFPTATAAEPLLVAAAEAVAHDEIRGARWPSPNVL